MHVCFSKKANPMTFGKSTLLHDQNKYSPSSCQVPFICVHFFYVYHHSQLLDFSKWFTRQQSIYWRVPASPRQICAIKRVWRQKLRVYSSPPVLLIISASVESSAWVFSPFYTIFKTNSNLNRNTLRAIRHMDHHKHCHLPQLIYCV